MEKEFILEAAEALHQAEKNITPIDALTTLYPHITMEDSYHIQLENIKRRENLGMKIVGKKIGLTSFAMQSFLGVSEPDYGHLLEDMVGYEAVPIKTSSLLKPRVEAELAFILKEELHGPGITIAQVLKATEGVMAAFEIIDSRIKDWKIKIQDTIADNASSAMVILGSQLIPIKEIDLKTVGLVLEKNGRIIDTAAGAAVLGHPAAAVAWLANKLSAYDIYLKPGEIILSGSLTKAYDISNKDTFRATFGQIGSVSAAFE